MTDMLRDLNIPFHSTSHPAGEIETEGVNVQSLFLIPSLCTPAPNDVLIRNRPPKGETCNNYQVLTLAGSFGSENQPDIVFLPAILIYQR